MFFCGLRYGKNLIDSNSWGLLFKHCKNSKIQKYALFKICTVQKYALFKNMHCLKRSYHQCIPNSFRTKRDIAPIFADLKSIGRDNFVVKFWQEIRDIWIFSRNEWSLHPLAKVELFYSRIIRTRPRTFLILTILSAMLQWHTKKYLYSNPRLSSFKL